MTPRADPAGAERAIIHVDMDAFYASVEQLDDPGYRNRPVIVGGLGRRGVVAAANYDARQYGVHSAMPMARARSLCPDGVYLTPRFDRYRDVSASVFAIFHEFTPLVEGISLDEAWLDVTDSRSLFGNIEDIGRRVKQTVRERTGLVASVGMAPNKFLAKLASDVDKPDGWHRVRADEAVAFLSPLPVERLWGIGPKAAQRLRDAGIRTVGDLEGTSVVRLRTLLGNSAAHFRALARGMDDRPVTPSRPEKSISHEVTFDTDLVRLDDLQRRLMALTEDVGTRLRRKVLAGGRVIVKIRTPDWRTHTRSRTLSRPTASTRELYRCAAELLARWREQFPTSPVRLLGVGAGDLEGQGQAGLFDGADDDIDDTLDDIRRRFGGAAVVRGRLVGRSDSD